MCSDETMMRISAIEDAVLGMLEMQAVRGLENADAEELGKATDILKDLAEAKYYCSVVMAMDGGESMGYNNRRYASGRFAPAGRGTMGYGTGDAAGHPEPQYLRDGGVRTKDAQEGPMGYGGAYSRYQQAKMGYAQAKTAENRKGMNDAANEHLREFEESMMDMWQDADQSQRMQMRNALVQFVNDLK